MARRLGLKTLRTLAHTFCQKYVLFAPAIQVLFGSNAAVVLAAEAVNVACAELVREVDAVTTQGT